MSTIPEKLTDFRCYGGTGAAELLGMTDVELPKFEALAEKIAGAGIAGEYESPTPGHFGSQVLKLKWRTVTRAALGLLDPTVQHSLDLRGAVQVRDSALGSPVQQSFRVEVRGHMKGFNPGKLEPGKPLEVDCEIEVATIRISIDGEPLIELDKFNSIFKVFGDDKLRATRVATGGV